jgi:hypothetical protein
VSHFNETFADSVKVPAWIRQDRELAEHYQRLVEDLYEAAMQPELNDPAYWRDQAAGWAFTVGRSPDPDKPTAAELLEMADAVECGMAGGEVL